MTNKIEKIHFINGEPNIAEMTEIISRTGFRPMTSATPSTLPVGAVVLVYDSGNHVLFPIVVYQHHFKGFSYMHFEQLNNTPDIGNMDSTYDFKKFMYKVLFHLPEANCIPSKEIFDKALAEIGFKPLTEATPEDLPQGCIALISYKNSSLCPVIVRVLSMSNRRLLYLDQSAIVAGDWHSNVIMDELKPFKNFSYLVIS